MDIPVVQNAREPLVSQLEHFVALASGEADAAQELETLRPPHAVVAKIVEVSPAHVDGVLTFYTMYNLRPVGKNLLQVCTSISCHLAGAGRLLEQCRKRLGVDLEQTTPDGKFTIVEVECIAGCDRAPSMMVNDTYHEPMDEKKLDALLDKLSADA